MEPEVFYIVRQKESGNISKGSRSTHSWQDSKTMFVQGKRPHKLYTLGSAKSIVTSNKKGYWDPEKHAYGPGPELEIIPVTLTFGEPI